MQQPRRQPDEHGRMLPDVDRRQVLPDGMWLVCAVCGGTIFDVDHQDIRCMLCGYIDQRYRYVAATKEAA